MPLKISLSVWVTAASLLSSGLATAEPTAVMFALTIDRDTADWSYAGAVHETRLTQLGVSYHEAYGPALTGGLHGGLLDVSQTDNPATTGMDVSGNYFGISLYYQTPIAIATRAVFQGGYTYRVADGDNGQQFTELQWHELRGLLALKHRYRALEVTLGPALSSLDGDETADGLITRNRIFKQHKKTSGILALEYWLDVTGSISLSLEAGARRATRLLFSRTF